MIARSGRRKVKIGISPNDGGCSFCERSYEYCRCAELYNMAVDACIAAFNDWLKEQKPIVLPEKRKLPDEPIPMHTKEYFLGWNCSIDEFLRLNPQIKRGEG